jgi:hypothetical protein
MDFDRAKIANTAGIYFALAQQFRGAVLPEKTDFRAFRGSLRYVPEPRVDIIENATVLAGEWFVAAGSDVRADFYVQQPVPPRSAYLMQFVGARGIELLFEPPIRSPVDEAFLLGGCASYTHWLIDYLPRLALCPDAKLPLLTNAPLGRHQRAALALLGVDDARLVALDYPAAYEVRRLHYPSLASSCIVPPHSFRPELIDWLRQSFAQCFAPGGKAERRLFISRAGMPYAHGLRLINHEEIEAAAERLGFEIVMPEKLGFAEQIAMFSGARVIVGAHGSGFANMVFAPKGAAIIEMIGPVFAADPLSTAFQKFAAHLGQRHTRLVGMAAGPVTLNHPPYETYTIDPAAFARACVGLEAR